MSIAPIITGMLLVLSPSEAMKMANIRVSNWLPLNETPDRMLCSISICDSRSPFTSANDLMSFHTRRVEAFAFPINPLILPLSMFYYSLSGF